MKIASKFSYRKASLTCENLSAGAGLSLLENRVAKLCLFLTFLTLFQSVWDPKYGKVWIDQCLMLVVLVNYG